MIRTILIPDNSTISLDVPENYIGREVEVIAFPKDEGLTKEKTAAKKVSFTVLHVDTTDYKFNRDEANER